MKTSKQKTVKTMKSAANNGIHQAGRDDAPPTAEAPEIQIVSRIILDATSQRASDIHLEPCEKGGLLVRFRVDGLMQSYKELAPDMALQVLDRLKLMAGMNIAEKRLPQDGRVLIKAGDKPLDLRVSVIRTMHGERVTIRMMNFDATENISLDKIDLGAEELREIRRALAGSGIIICSGPVGSGKTTVLYSMIQEINDGRRTLFSVENPVEYILPGVSQVQVQPQIGLTFTTVLRSVLRQAPDAIMISELRDIETVQLAVEAALTGHLVLTQLHTNSAAAALRRLVDIGLEPFLVGDTVKVIINQRLVRKLCVHCRKPTALPAAQLPEKVAEFAASLKDAQFCEPAGCDTCNGTGYRGRAAIFEVLFMSGKLKDALCAKADDSQLTATAQAEGMKTILQDGIRKAAAGVTSIQEVMRVYASQG